NVPLDEDQALGNRIGPSTRDGPVAFTTTHWSVVVEAQGPSPAAEAALEKLCRGYWRPIYSFVRRQGAVREEAEDLTQGFFARLFDRLKELLAGESGQLSQAKIAGEFGMTENAVKQAFHRFRQRYQLLLREEIAHTVAVPGDIEDELRHLIGILRE